jgi:sarcosine oxidase subunit gamma
MAETTTLRRSPLAHLTARLEATRASGERAVSLVEVPFLTMVGLRAAPASAAAERLGAVLGTSLPSGYGDVSANGPHSVLWLGPDEWLVVSEVDPDALTRQLVTAIDGDHAAAVDVSANRTVLTLRGPAARAVLQKGCPLDLHPRAFGVGRAASTTLARVPLLLWQSGPASYRLLPRSSFADYVARWLLDAMQEFSGPEVP